MLSSYLQVGGEFDPPVPSLVDVSRLSTSRRGGDGSNRQISANTTTEGESGVASTSTVPTGNRNKSGRMNDMIKGPLAAAVVSVCVFVLTFFGHAMQIQRITSE